MKMKDKSFKNGRRPFGFKGNTSFLNKTSPFLFCLILFLDIGLSGGLQNEAGMCWEDGRTSGELEGLRRKEITDKRGQRYSIIREILREKDKFYV
jgi:hypothetical protein